MGGVCLKSTAVDTRGRVIERHGPSSLEDDRSPILETDPQAKRNSKLRSGDPKADARGKPTAPQLRGGGRAAATPVDCAEAGKPPAATTTAPCQVQKVPSSSREGSAAPPAPAGSSKSMPPPVGSNKGALPPTGTMTAAAPPPVASAAPSGPPRNSGHASEQNQQQPTNQALLPLPNDTNRPDVNQGKSPAVTPGNSPSNHGHIAPSHDLPVELKKQLREVANENYQLRNQFGRVPRTIYVEHTHCKSFATPSSGPSSRVTTKSWSTADALLQYAADSQTRVCGLNFANGKNVGGGYKTGSMAQEEDLCRRMPTLYTSLYQASREGFYPFGPSTCTDAKEPRQYMDVLYTPGVVVARGGLEENYTFLPKAKQLKVDLVSAAAPNINFAKDIFDPELVYSAIVSILVAPKMQQPQTNTLVLGAWGCGAFGCDPAQVGDLFGRALADAGYGRLYREIHFAIPGGENAEALKAGLRKHRIDVQEV